MSKIIKASQITGEYRLEDIAQLKVKQKNNEPTSAAGDSTQSSSREDNERQGNETLDLEQVQMRAERMLAEARKKVEKMEQEAEKELENARQRGQEEGYQQGFQEGKEAGKQQGLNQFTQAINLLQRTTDEVREKMKVEKENLPRQVIDLAVKIARRIVNVELEINPDIINNIIKDILTGVGNTPRKIEIKVHPQLIDFIQEADIKPVNGQQTLEIIADESLQIGDCIVETDFGGKDGSLQNKFALLEKQLYQEVS